MSKIHDQLSCSLIEVCLRHNLAGVLEDLLEPLLESVNVVVNQVLLLVLSLVNQTDQSQTLVDLAQVKHDVVPVSYTHLTLPTICSV